MNSVGLLSVHVTCAAITVSGLVIIFHSQRRLVFGYYTCNSKNMRVVMSMAFTSHFVPTAHTHMHSKKEKGKRGSYHGLCAGGGRKVDQLAMATIGCHDIK